MFRMLALAVVASPAAALAQEPPPEAREFYARGQALYEEGRYREAIVELERAYALDPGGTILLYNIGLIYEKLGEVDRALEYYARYQRHDLSAAERERVEGVVRRIQGARGEVEDPVEGTVEGDPDPPPDPAPPRPPPRYGRADGLFWITAGVAAAALVAGGVFGAIALQNDADAKATVSADAGDLARRQDLAESADGQALVADVSIVSAVALGAVSALLYFLREAETAPASAAIAPAAGGAMAAVSARWP